MSRSAVRVPAELARLVSGHVPEPGMCPGSDWIDRLPALAAVLLAEGGPERATSLPFAVRLRLETLADMAGVEVDRARALTLVRLVRDALWELQVSSVDLRQVTRLVTVAKALQGR